MFTFIRNFCQNIQSHKFSQNFINITNFLKFFLQIFNFIKQIFIELLINFLYFPEISFIPSIFFLLQMSHVS